MSGECYIWRNNPDWEPRRCNPCQKIHWASHAQGRCADPGVQNELSPQGCMDNQYLASLGVGEHQLITCWSGWSKVWLSNRSDDARVGMPSGCRRYVLLVWAELISDLIYNYYHSISCSWSRRTAELRLSTIMSFEMQSLNNVSCFCIVRLPPHGKLKR